MDLGTPFHKLVHKYHIKTGYGGSMYMYICVDVWQGGGGGGQGRGDEKRAAQVERIAERT